MIDLQRTRSIYIGLPFSPIQKSRTGAAAPELDPPHEDPLEPNLRPQASTVDIYKDCTSVESQVRRVVVQTSATGSHLVMTSPLSSSGRTAAKRATGAASRAGSRNTSQRKHNL